MKNKIKLFKYGPVVWLWTGTFLMTAAITAVVFVILYPSTVISIIAGIVESSKITAP